MKTSVNKVFIVNSILRILKSSEVLPIFHANLQLCLYVFPSMFSIKALKKEF